jgi:EmrB/QacA subfamily drug resistance transporter
VFVTTEQCSPIVAPLALRRAVAVLIVVMIADVMDLLDSTIANLAGPSIRADLGGSETTLQWVLAAYTVTFAIGLVTSGRLGDLLGRRRLFLAGMAGFTLASLACGLAPSATFLIIARAVQGLAGSVMIPQGLALIRVVFPAEQLRRALIPFGPIMGLATVAGPILAGWLLALNLFGTQWRAIFLINVPIGITAAALGWFLLPRRAGEDPGLRLDVAGVGLLTLASLLLIVPLVEGREYGWPAWCWLMMVGAVPALVLFVISERRSRHPMITPTLFRRRSFVVGLVVTGSFFASFTGFQLAFNLLLQLGLGWTPLDTGLALIPWALGLVVAIGLGGAVLAERFGRGSVQLGLAIGVLGLLGLWWTLAHFQDQLTAWITAPSLAVIGFGSGMVFVRSSTTSSATPPSTRSAPVPGCSTPSSSLPTRWASPPWEPCSSPAPTPANPAPSSPAPSTSSPWPPRSTSSPCPWSACYRDTPSRPSTDRIAGQW